jgi:hypothetical protein
MQKRPTASVSALLSMPRRRGKQSQQQPIVGLIRTPRADPNEDEAPLARVSRLCGALAIRARATTSSSEPDAHETARLGRGGCVPAREAEWPDEAERSRGAGCALRRRESLTDDSGGATEDSGREGSVEVHDGAGVLTQLGATLLELDVTSTERGKTTPLAPPASPARASAAAERMIEPTIVFDRPRVKVRAPTPLPVSAGRKPSVRSVALSAPWTSACAEARPPVALVSPARVEGISRKSHKESPLPSPPIASNEPRASIATHLQVAARG